MSINKNGLPFGLAYMGCYLAYNGTEPNKAGLIDGAAEMSAAERQYILSSILKVVEMTEEDVDGDGVVDENDAEEILQAAEDQYTVDVVTEEEMDGEMYTKTILFNVDFHVRMRDAAPDAVKEFIMNFYEGIMDSTDSGSTIEGIERKQVESWRKLLYNL